MWLSVVMVQKPNFFSDPASCLCVSSVFLKLGSSEVHLLSYDEGKYADKLLLTHKRIK